MIRYLLIFLIMFSVNTLDAQTVTTYNSGGTSYSLATFVNTGGATWTVPAGVTSIDVLAVAGGGSGGPDGGSGGGGGEMRYGTSSVSAGTIISVTIGSGGIHGTSNDAPGNPGGNTQIAWGSVTQYSAIGGSSGIGWSTSHTGGSGGSGGSGGTGIGGGTGGTGLGVGCPSGDSYLRGGDGVDGGTNSIRTNSAVYYGGGGGGGTAVERRNYSSNIASAPGGNGGGGGGSSFNATTDASTSGYPGADNSGGGGGGGSACGATGDGDGTIQRTYGGNGGSGIVVLRYTVSTGTVSADQFVCTGTSPSNITITGNTGSIQWQSSANQSSWSNITGATAATLTGAQTGTLSQTTYFRAELNNDGNLFHSNKIIVTVGSPFSPPSKTLAHLAVTGTNIKWYTAASGGSELPSSTSITATSTTYYASQTINSVESTARLAVTARVDPTPCKPTGDASQSYSSGSTVSNLQATGTSIRWYSDESSATALASATALVNGTTYYATQTVGCTESATRLAVTVTLN